MEKHVYLVRHGQSDSNADGIYRGKEAQLTDTGREQAKAVAERIERIGVEALITSQFPRATETAGFIGERLGLAPIQNESFGEWNEPSPVIGMHKHGEEAKKIFDRILHAVDDHHFQSHDEETFVDLLRRADAALEALLTHPAERIAVVTHGGFLRMLIGRVVFGPDFSKKHFVDLLKNMLTTNTGITYITYTEERPWWHLISWNDISHFG